MDAKSLGYNPYDFANPVSDEALLVGRAKELAEMDYYLKHACHAPRPISLALVGGRASGKTSMLNIVDTRARRLGLCVARVDLDEGDVQTELRFFNKFLGTVLSSACDAGAFGGLMGKTYECYLDMVSTYTVPEDKLFCPFLSPITYARAMASGNEGAQVSDYNIKRDLDSIAKDLGHRIAVLVDEGDVLGQNRIVLEKLRNILSQTTAFMLVLSGTPALFPVLDEVFSPIVRQFKKIEIREFNEWRDTADCIREPLVRAGLRPEDYFDFAEPSVREMHSLAGGRPYETQLICHVLFRRLQDGRTARMRLSAAALEDVRDQLEATRAVADRPVLAAIKRLSKRDLEALSLVCITNGKASINQVLAIEHTLFGEDRWRETELTASIERMKALGVLTEVAGGEPTERETPRPRAPLKFCGDEFDSIYVKYYAREREVPLQVAETPFPILWVKRLRQFLGANTDITVAPLATDCGVEDYVIETARALDELGPGDVLADEPRGIVLFLYGLMLEHRASDVVPVCVIEASFPWFDARTWLFGNPKWDAKAMQECVIGLQDAASRARQVQGKVETRFETVRVAPPEMLAEKVLRTENRRVRQEIVSEHAQRMVTAYLNEKDVQEAYFHAGMCETYEPLLESSSALNNLGYILMAKGDLLKARTLLNKALSSAKDKRERALALYNLGILDTREDLIPQGRARLHEVVKQIEEEMAQNRMVGCLFVVVRREGQLSFEERFSPDILQAARESLMVLMSIQE